MGISESGPRSTSSKESGRLQKIFRTLSLSVALGASPACGGPSNQDQGLIFDVSHCPNQLCNTETGELIKYCKPASAPAPKIGETLAQYHERIKSILNPNTLSIKPVKSESEQLEDTDDETKLVFCEEDS